MHVAITGSTGLVGTELIPFLTTSGHQITRLVRGEAGQGRVVWDPATDQFDSSGLDGIDAVVHLAGENIAARRWSARQKQRIRESRVRGTRVLSGGLASMQTPPKVLVAASAIGFYGNRGDERLAETSEPGTGFLADVCREWETATEAARDAGIRVVNLRIGVVLSSRGGALAKMLLPFKLGLGGIVGSGRQYWSWIDIDDLVGAIYHSLITDSLAGPVNAVAPNPVTNREFTKTLGRVLARPTIMPLPGFVARLMLGEMANDLLLGSTRVTPARLEETGYEFRHAELAGSLGQQLGR